MRFQIKPKLYVAEALMHPLVYALCSIPFLGRTGVMLFVLAALVKITLEYLNLLSQRRSARPLRTALLFPLVVVVKDILSFARYLTPFLARRVNWRGRSIVVGKDSLILPEHHAELEYEA
jgi:hypothetical protein